MKQNTHPNSIFLALDKFGVFENEEIFNDITLDFASVQFVYPHKKLTIKDVTFKGAFTISNVALRRNDRLQFVNCTFHKNVKVESIEMPTVNLMFTGCNFQEGVEYTNIDAGVLMVKDCVFNQCRFVNVDAEIRFWYNEVNNLSLVDIKNYNCDIRSARNKLCETIVINSPELEILSISSVNTIRSLEIYNVGSAELCGEYEDVFLMINKFDKILISPVGILDINEFPRVKIDSLKYSLSSPEGILTIEESDIKLLHFDELNSNSGRVVLNEVTLNKSIFDECVIENFYWNQLTFQEPPAISRCDLSELKMSNVVWPKGKKLKDSFLDEKIPPFYSLLKNYFKKNETDYSDIEISDLRYQRDTYRQLKAASLANKNQIEALEFYKNEMKLYWKEIRLVGGQFWYDRVLIFINRWVSNFGQDWHMPFLWLIAFHLLFYSCLFNFNYWSNGFDYSQELGNYFYLLNPAHKTPEYINTGWGQITEFFMRVFAGFFIYHFIKATRKFGKI